MTGRKPEWPGGSALEGAPRSDDLNPTRPEPIRAGAGDREGDVDVALAAATAADAERRRMRRLQAVRRGYLQVALFWMWAGAGALLAELLGVGGIEAWPTAALLVLAAEIYVALGFVYHLRVLRSGRPYHPKVVVTAVTTAGSIFLIAFNVLDGFTVLTAVLLVTGTVLNLAAFAEANGFRATFVRSVIQTLVYGAAYALAPKNALSLSPQSFAVVLVSLPVVGLILGTIAARYQENRTQIVELLRVQRQQTAELAATNMRLSELSTIDGLTGIANRRRFDEELTRELRRSQRRRGAPDEERAALDPAGGVALILIDVDYFKEYNDRLGHLAGDECLRRVAQVLQRRVRRAGDSLARYGGEEFALLLPETDLEGARRVGELVQQAIAELAIPHPASPVAPVITVSGGIATSSCDAEADPRALVARADAALYRAKARGKARMETSDELEELEPGALGGPRPA